MEVFKDKEFLETLVKAIVGAPEKVSVERTVDEMGVLLTLKIDRADMGYVIGRKGQTAQAIRTLLKIVGAKNNARVNLKIYEPNGGMKGGMKSAAKIEDNTLDQEIDTSSLDDLTI